MIPSLQSIENLVKESFDRLKEEDVAGEMLQLDVARGGSRLSDKGLLEALPQFLPKLKRTALHSILSTLSGRKREARNRPWLLEKINQELGKFVAKPQADRSQTTLESLLRVLRDPKSIQDEVNPGEIQLEASCPWTAAKSALSQIEQLPLQCLQVMLEVLSDKPPDLLVGKLPVGSNKERVVSALLERSYNLLNIEQPGQALPELLRRCLITMSISARYAFGSDDNLIDFLGPQSLQNRGLQDSLLSALTDLKKLDYEDLCRIGLELIAIPRTYKKRHPSYLRQSIKRVLLDCLLRSEVRAVPEEVIKVLSMISVLGKQTQVKKRKTAIDSNVKNLRNDGQPEREVESILRVSSCLEQIMFNWIEDLLENSGNSSKDSRQLLDLDGNLMNISEGTMTDPVRNSKDGNGVEMINPSGDSMAEDLGFMTESIRNSWHENAKNADIQGDLLEETTIFDLGKNFKNCESVQSPLSEAVEIRDLTRIADEVAAVGYTLIGSAMERTMRDSGTELIRPVRKYLRTGMTSRMPILGRNDLKLDQLTTVLSIAERIPIISPKVMENVKRRLGIQ